MPLAFDKRAWLHSPAFLRIKSEFGAEPRPSHESSEPRASGKLYTAHSLQSPGGASRCPAPEAGHQGSFRRNMRVTGKAFVYAGFSGHLQRGGGSPSLTVTARARISRGKHEHVATLSVIRILRAVYRGPCLGAGGCRLRAPWPPRHARRSPTVAVGGQRSAA